MPNGLTPPFLVTAKRLQNLRRTDLSQICTGECWSTALSRFDDETGSVHSLCRDGRVDGNIGELWLWGEVKVKDGEGGLHKANGVMGAGRHAGLGTRAPTFTGTSAGHGRGHAWLPVVGML